MLETKTDEKSSNLKINNISEWVNVLLRFQDISL